MKYMLIVLTTMGSPIIGEDYVTPRGNNKKSQNLNHYSDKYRLNLFYILKVISSKSSNGIFSFLVYLKLYKHTI